MTVTHFGTANTEKENARAGARAFFRYGVYCHLKTGYTRVSRWLFPSFIQHFRPNLIQRLFDFLLQR